MGLGGNLVWTRVLSALYECERHPPVPCHMPLLSDLVAGRLYDGARTLRYDPIFRNNPRLWFNEVRPKSVLVRLIDLAFRALLYPTAIRRAYESFVFRAAEALASKGERHLVHVDMLIHSYAERQGRRRFVWKTGGTIADVIADPFGLPRAAADCELYFDASEEADVEAIRRQYDLGQDYIVVEPDTNRDWFGELRMWPLDRWQAVVNQLATACPGVRVAQVGVDGSPVLDGVVNLCGRMSFRTAALLMRTACLFLGTEGGLMHAADAVGVPAVIVWGGVTLPDFAGYPARHRIIRHAVPCAPCGNFGWCDHDHACMKGTGVDEVVAAVLAAIGPGAGA